ncbi:hypothetical protein ACFX1X_008918 [Malus domestica]
MKKFDVNEVVNTIDEYKVTHFPVVPPILTALTIKVKDGLAEQSLKSLKQWQVWWMKKVGRYRLVAFVVRKHGSRISKENVMDLHRLGVNVIT